MKRCYFCRGEVIEKRISHVHSWGDKLVVFRDIPAEVCKQCGETYLEPGVLKAFDKATAHLERVRETIQVPVVAYQELAGT